MITHTLFPNSPEVLLHKPARIPKEHARSEANQTSDDSLRSCDGRHPADLRAASTQQIRDLRLRMVSVEKLIPYARNARTHSASQVRQIAASIREFGWTNPLLVQPEGVIIAGHARLLAARQLGIEEVPVIELAGLSQAQCRALVIADNQ